MSLFSLMSFSMSESDILHSQNIIRFEKSRGERVSGPKTVFNGPGPGFDSHAE